MSFPFTDFRMDDPHEDWKIEEQTTCEYLKGGLGGKGNVRWILEEGMNLGKKAVITGLVMSSAPVVLPPILVVSAVGFAFSVPFVLVCTGYVCTQKLMSSLLPMPTESPMLEYDKMFYDEIEGVEGRGEEGEYHIDMDKEEKEQMAYERAGVEERIELVKDKNEVNQTEEEGEWGVGELRVEGGGDMGKEERDLKIEETELLRKVDNYEEVKPEGDPVDANAILKKQNTAEEDIRRGSVGLLEKIKNLGNAYDGEKKTKKKRNKKTTSKGSAEMPFPDEKDQSVISKNQQSGPEKGKRPEDRNKVGMQQSPVGGAAGSSRLIPLQENITTSYPPRESEKSVATSRPEATEVDEEKIWEQIDELRTIVGYKATPHRSSTEEVKALYVFAGVKLPSSSGHQPDLAELSSKIRFLMSVVGVK